MKGILAHKSLFYWLVSPLVGVLLLFALAFYIFLLSPFQTYIESQIAGSMHEIVNDIYRICDQKFLQSYQLGAHFNTKEIRVTKAYTLGAIEDFMRRQDSMIFVYQDDKILLAPEEAPDLVPQLKSITPKYPSDSHIKPLKLQGRDYYVSHIDFAPWNWHITVLRDSSIYYDLHHKLYAAYMVTFIILLSGALLIFFAINIGVYRPLKNIIEPLRKGEEINYKGISEFEFLGGQLQKAINEQKIEHQKYKSLVDSSPLGILIYQLEADNRLVFVGANQAANDILHVDCSKYIGKTIEEAFPPLAETEVPDIYRRACKEGIPWDHEQIDYNDGSIVGAFEVNAFQISPGMMAVFFRDRTREIKLEEEVQKAKKIESIGVLAGGIAHDFNNILTAILGNLSLAKRFINKDDIVYQKLEASENAVNRAQNLTYQLLTFAKGGAPIIKPVSIHELVSDSVLFALSGSNINCSFSGAEDLWSVEVDAGQIDQVMQNIATNAVQAMPDGGNLQIILENYEKTGADNIPLSPGNYVKISFIDEGVGIPAKQIEKIFDPFYTSKAGGSGLGLAICYSIIKKHRGLITVESRKGVGTTFRVYLPASSEKISSKAYSEKQVLPGQGRILVMDDDKAVREIASELLSHAGYEVRLAADGEEALDFYRNAMATRQPFDLVILDLTVAGGLGGRKTMEKLQEIDPQVRAIVSSGYSNDAVMNDFARYGFKHAVAKPYTLENLSKAVHSVLE